MSAAYSALDMTTSVGAISREVGMAMGCASMPDTIAAPRAVGDEAATASCRFQRSMPPAGNRRMGSRRAANGLRTRWAVPGASGTLWPQSSNARERDPVFHRELTASDLNDAVLLDLLRIEDPLERLAGEDDR